MKKIVLITTLVLALGLMASQAFARGPGQGGRQGWNAANCPYSSQQNQQYRNTAPGQRRQAAQTAGNQARFNNRAVNQNSNTDQWSCPRTGLPCRRGF